MKKISILTFHFTDNPGSALQAYALKSVIEKMGVQCDILNYMKRGWKKSSYGNYLPYFKAKFKGLGVVPWVLFIPILKMRLLKFKSFQRKYQKVTGKSISSAEQLLRLNTQYDYFIVGSDQIWNRNNVKVDDTYFLNFVSDNTKKIAYAPSFGVSQLTVDESTHNAELLAQFNHLSVRELQGQAIIRDICGVTVPVVLDPTLLIQVDEWKNIAHIPKVKDYILVYLRKISPSAARFVKILSEKTGLAVVQVTGIRKRADNGLCVHSPNPQEWLGLFYNAKYIITNSFHGVAFSINFNKQFYVEPIRGSQEENNSRIYSILEQFDLQNRIIDENVDFSHISEIDYKTVNQKLDEKRDYSISYLKNALFGGDNN